MSLPDFLIIGASKSGTTSMLEYLNEHPDIWTRTKDCVGRVELNYFTHQWDKKDEGWYASLLTDNENLLIGEKSVSYIYFKEGPKNAKKTIPDAKFIALFRKPVERAYSMYQMKVDYNEPRPNEPELKENRTWREVYETSLKSSLYFNKSIYYPQIKRWFNYFDRDQFKLLCAERFFENTPEVLKEVHKFLGVNPMQNLYDFIPHNFRPYDEMDDDIYRELEEYYRPKNEKFFELIGKDFSEWWY